MAGTLPYLSSGNVCMLPLTFGYTFQTGVVRFQNGYEQRYQTRPALAAFELVYTNINLTDRQAIDTFFNNQKGSADNSWTFILNKDAGGLLQFPGCAFDQDELVWTENRAFPNYYSTSIRFHQTTVGGIPNGYNPGGFPPLGPQGIVSTGYPFMASTRFRVARVDLPTGPRWTYPWDGAGLTNFPSRALRAWTLTLNSVDYTTVAKVAQHYVGCLGKYALFAFIDPTDKKQYTRVRYDMDSLSINSLRMNNYNMQLKLVEVFGPGWVA